MALIEVVARIRRNRDGYEAETTDFLPDGADDEGIIYHWTAGNFGCDCNRSLFAGDAGDSDDCGNTRFSLVRLARNGVELDFKFEEDHR